MEIIPTGSIQTEPILTEPILKIGDQDYYPKKFSQKFPEPPIESDEGAIQKAQMRHVLQATNAIHEKISAGVWDATDAENAFHEIHFIHSGEDDPVKHVLATLDLDPLGTISDLPVWLQADWVARQMGTDISYQKGVYRTTPISWGPQGRGVLGIDSGDVADFAKNIFASINQTIQKTKLGEHPDLQAPEGALTYAVAVGSLINIAHLKKDLNWRSSEDFIVWLQRQLSGPDTKPKFLSSSGLRIGCLEKIIKPEFLDDYFKTKVRIYDRIPPILHVRQNIYSDLAKDLNITPAELAEQMKESDFPNKETYMRQQEIRKQATPIFSWLSHVAAIPRLASQEPFPPIVDYFKQKGVDTYTVYTPDQVLNK
jgi:hypothetical protein